MTKKEYCELHDKIEWVHYEYLVENEGNPKVVYRCKNAFSEDDDLKGWVKQ